MLAQITWEKTRKNDARFFSTGHDYIIVYAKSQKTLRENKTIWREAKPGAQQIIETYKELRKTHGSDNETLEQALRLWFSELPEKHLSKRLSRYKQVDDFGPWRDADISWPGGGGPRYDVIHPQTGKACLVPDRGWRFSASATMQRHIDSGLIYFREDHSEPPMMKKHLIPIPEEIDETAEQIDEENAEVALQVMPTVFYKQSQVAVKFLRKLLGSIAFNNPKDHEVLARLVRYCTQRNSQDIVLDCTAGSGTTAHAVLQLNAEDGGNRRFILVQRAQDTKDDERRAVNICYDITRERVRRVIKGVNTEALGGSFTYARLSKEPMLGIHRDLQPGLSFLRLAQYLFYTVTSRQLDESLMNPETGYLGQWSGGSLYLRYSEKEDEEGTLDRKWLDMVAAHDSNSRLVVFCERFLVHREDLRDWQNEHRKTILERQIPFNLP